jgi:multicomponent Na+:H+ antiporter subunit D
MNIVEQAPILIIVIPMMAALLNTAVGLWNRNLCYPLVVATLGICVLLSFNIMGSVIDLGKVHYRLGGWAPPWGIEYVIDHLNAYIAVIVTFISFIVSIYSKRSIEQELLKDKITYFYSIYLLLTTGLLGITLTGDVFNIYVFLEITSLAAYALIAIGDDRAAMASFNYVIMGTVGACFYLLGVGYLYIMTGTLNMADLTKLLPNLYNSTVVLASFAFFIVGVAIKIAFFPLHRWLPDAYTHAPSTVSAIVASTMTKVGAYVMIRIMFTVFEPRFSSDILPMADILGWAAFAAIMAGSVIALGQTDIKKMISYILVAEVGYIVMGVSIGNRTAFTGAVLHILNDAFMMACLFLVIGAVVYRTGTKNINDFNGLELNKKMPLTMAAFTIAAISMIGVPPTAGFFSKWYLLLGALNAEKWFFAAALIFSSLINAILFFRILEKVYFKTPIEHSNEGHEKIARHEAPASMLVPIYVMAAGILMLGFYSGDIISTVIQFTVPEGF